MAQIYEQPSGFYDSMIAVLDTLYSGENVDVQNADAIADSEDELASHTIFPPIFHSMKKIEMAGGQLHQLFHEWFTDEFVTTAFLEYSTNNPENMQSLQRDFPDFLLENLVLPPEQKKFYIASFIFQSHTDLYQHSALELAKREIEIEKAGFISYLKSFEKKNGIYQAPHYYDSEEHALAHKDELIADLARPAIFHHNKIPIPPRIRKEGDHYRLAYPPKFIEPIITGELGPEHGRDNPITR